MTRRTKRSRKPAFKAQVALVGLKSDETLAKLAQPHDRHPSTSFEPGRTPTTKASVTGHWRSRNAGRAPPASAGDCECLNLRDSILPGKACLRLSLSHCVTIRPSETVRGSSERQMKSMAG